MSDDGETLNTTNRQNIYQFDFKATYGCNLENNAGDGSIFMNITMLAEATERDVRNATAMDFLGKMVIYNTKEGDLKLPDTYDVTVNFKNGTHTKLPTKAEFFEYRSQTVFE